ncbi:MAG: hypothetical protein GXY13_00875 [Acidimicrobiales bacterium]|nr:hypothetical protein [Acidimicrobiales bacterium]
MPVALPPHPPRRSPAVRPRPARLAAALLLVLVLLLAACSSEDGTDAAGDPSVNDPVTDEPADEDSAAAEPAAAWEKVVPGGDCRCADDSEYAFWVHEGDPTRVAVVLQGGGACFDAASCTFVEGPYKPRLFQEDDPEDGDGLLDVDDERNPLADWSIIFAPYCTGDLHLGTTTQEDAPDQVVHHAGLANGTAVLDALGARFPDAEQVLVAGESAGGAAAPVYGGLAADRLPDATITVLADGAGAYPDDPAVNTLAGERWGTDAAVPDWEETAGLTTAELGLPSLYVYVGRHDPDIRFGRRDFAEDAVQEFYAQLAGLGDDVLAQIDRNERDIEAEGIDLTAFVSPGEHHTILTTPYLWDHRVEGVSLVDWIADLLAGTADDVRCATCRPA